MQATSVLIFTIKKVNVNDTILQIKKVIHSQICFFKAIWQHYLDFKIIKDV